MKINMCSVGDKVPSAACFQAWRRMLDNATVTTFFFHLHVQVNFMVIAFPATHLISLAMAI